MVIELQAWVRVQGAAVSTMFVVDEEILHVVKLKDEVQAWTLFRSTTRDSTDTRMRSMSTSLLGRIDHPDKVGRCRDGTLALAVQMRR